MTMESKKNNVVWLQLSAGQGPRECGWVVAQLLRVLLHDAQKHGFSAECVERMAFDKVMRKQNLIEPDALLSCLIRLERGSIEGRSVKGGNVKDQGLDSYARSWIGPIKWQGESMYRSKHKRCNWFVGIESVCVTGPKPIDMKHLAHEVDVEAMRSSGPGGQHVNKTSSAIRITHRPTGTQVRVESDRSQHRNRQLAMERLHMILAASELEEGGALVRDRWVKHYHVKRGDPVRVFQGEGFVEIGV